MIHLNPNDSKINTALLIHINSLFKIIKNRVKNCDDIYIKDFLTDENITTFLEGKPDEIELLNNQFYSYIKKFSIDEYNSFKVNIDKKTTNKVEKENIKKFKKLHFKIEAIFKYKNSFNRKKTKYSTYTLADNLNVNTCVYCNRIYTKTVVNPNKLTRPEFDHWFPQSKYPLLALSFFNLIPSCHICNSTLKQDKDINFKNHLHPYIDNEITINKEIKFSYYNKTTDSYEFKMITNNPKGDNNVNLFKIKEIYETHEDEIKELRRIRDVYSESYLLKLSKIYNLNISEEEIYRLAFGVYIEDSKFEKRPFSKMKKDILIELGIIKPNEND